MRKNHTRMNMIGEDVLLRYHYDNNHDDTDNNHKIKNSRTQVKSSEVK